MHIRQNIETPRLVIRSWRASDKSFTLALWGDEETGRYMSDPTSEHVDEKYLSYFDDMEDAPDGYYLIAELKETGEAIGTCCAFPEEGNYDIGYCLTKGLWKQGFGTEMISALIAWIRSEGGRSVTAEVADENKASVALLGKLGFKADKKTRFKKWGEEKNFEAHIYKLELK